MISIIMPTLWKGEYYKTMLPLFDAHPLVGEIIVIDNDKERVDSNIFNLKKLKYLPQQENIYVNPAWNLGVEQSTNEVVCLYSDDVLFNLDCLQMIYDKCIPENGIVGFSIEGISETINNLETLAQYVMSWETQRVIPTPSLHYRFGICMFMHKSSYYTIPEQYKIYYGDTYLFDQNVLNNKQHFKIEGCPVATKMKTTSMNFKQIIEEDDQNFNQSNPSNAMIADLIKELEKQIS